MKNNNDKKKNSSYSNITINKLFIIVLFSLLIIINFNNITVIPRSVNQTIYEDQKVYADTSDGISKFLGISNIDDWNKVRNNNTGNQYNDEMNVYYKGVLAAFNPKQGDLFVISRSYFAFNTSFLGIDAEIKSVKLNMYGAGANESRVCIVEWTDGYDGIYYDDYGYIGSINLGISSDWINNKYNQISLNEIGINYINKTGYTYICCREYDHDFLNISPNNTRLDEYRNGHYFSDEPGTDKDPFLQISYFNMDQSTSPNNKTNNTTFLQLSTCIIIISLFAITIINKKKKEKS